MLYRSRTNSIHRRLAAILAVLLLTPAGISAQNTAQDKPIVEIKIVGNQRVSSEAIQAAIALKPGAPFTEKAVQEAKAAIESMGYFQKGVIVGTETLESGVRVVFNVIENPVVKEIKITGNTVIETDKLRSVMRTTVGNVLNVNTLQQQDIPAIEALYDEQGYFAFVNEGIGIDPDTGVLTIPITEARIQEIKVTGLKKTKPYVVLREMQQKPGDVYNKKTLSRDLLRIYELGIFEIEGAQNYQVDPGSDLGQVIVTIPVKERKTGEVAVGLGYSSKQKLVGQAKLSETNFRGRAQTVNLLWEQSGSRGSSYEVGFYEPWLDKKHTSLGVSLYNKLIFRFTSNILGSTGSSDTDYDERRKGGSVTLSRPFGQLNRGFVTLRSESVDTNLIGAPSPLISEGSVTSGTFRFTNDSRDSSLDPLGGQYNSFAVEVGDAKFEEAMQDSENTFFTKYSVDVRRYFSKGGARKEVSERRPALAVRLLGGSLTGNVPFFEQYFVGGAETLRGFKEDRFWGKHMFLASAEYRFPVAPSLTGVAFVDYGDAWGAASAFRQSPVPERNDDGSIVTDPITGDIVYQRDQDGNLVMTDLIPGFSQHEGFSPSVGYGIGIRVVTPIGPLRLDYGFSKEGSRAHFSIGHAF